MHYKKYKSILSPGNNMNIYRGCTHGCIYCDSRSRCYQMDHDFEDIEVKTCAPELLEEQLSRRRARAMIGTGAMCDPYIQLEAELCHTRRCIEVILKYGFGLAIQTKSDFILRDLDLLCAVNEQTKCVVQFTLTTYDEDLCAVIEPNVSTTKARFEALKTLRRNGIPTVVWFGPLLPFINDTEENLRGILKYCAEAEVYGIICFGIGLTLREGNREYFYIKLEQYFPGLKQIYQRKYGDMYNCYSDNNGDLMRVFHTECERLGIKHSNDEIFKYIHTYEDKNNPQQLRLF